MKGNYEKNTLLVRLIDDVCNNKLGSYTYKNYIKTLNLKGDENILDFKSASGQNLEIQQNFFQKMEDI